MTISHEIETSPTSIRRVFLLKSIWGLAVAVMLLGCGSAVQGVTSAPGAGSDVVLGASPVSVRVGGTSALTALIKGVADQAGTWGVIGGISNGSVDSRGVYHAPATLPSPTQITVMYSRGESSSELTLSLLNPIPSVASATPNIILSASTLLTISGSGFVPGSIISANGTPLPTNYLDSQHVSGMLNLGGVTNTSIDLSVSNPDPGASTSYHIQVATAIRSFAVSPQTLSGGDVIIAWTGSGIPADAKVIMDGRQLETTSVSSSSITAKGFLPPWKTGSSDVQLISARGNTVLGDQNLPIDVTAASFDSAARFSTQAVFGPRPDVVTHIQHIGLSAFIEEQFKQPAVVYDPGQDAATQFNQQATSGSSLLRLRLAWALQNFIVAKNIDREFAYIPFEQMLERDCSGNFRQLMSDISSDPSVAFLLNLGGNAKTQDPTQSPNQNFARELMQLFTLGPVLLNDDGSEKLDAHGNAMPTYTQAQVVDLSRVFTGWNYPPPVNKAFTSYYGIDLSQPLIGTESQHDQGSKLIVGATSIPAGTSIREERRLALDAIFMHANLPPFISRLLIQHLVKSSPSPSYVQRISRVFEDDGTGTRGNLKAVVSAILLDQEARSGDTIASADDGFLQEPLLFQMFAVSLTESPLSDSQSNYLSGTLGQAWWGGAPSVFGYYRPDNHIPGTDIVSPEFQILTNQNIIIRSQYLWGIVTGTEPGLSSNPKSWLLSRFSSVPDLIEALDHLAFHGTMPAYEKASIQAYCDKIGPDNKMLQFQSALFLALNSDHYSIAR